MLPNSSLKPRAGLMAVGLGSYWPQFPGMRDGVLSAHKRVASLIEEHAEIVPAGLIDSATRARQAGELFRGSQVDMVFCHLSTYANSETLLPAVVDLDVPVVLLNVQPVRALEFEKVTRIEEWLGVACTCAALPEMTAALIRLKKRFSTVTGHLQQDQELIDRLREWCVIGGIRRRLHSQSMALLGRPFAGMMDLHLDETHLFKTLGMFVKHLDWDDVIEEKSHLAARDLQAHVDRLTAAFEMPSSLSKKDIEEVAGTTGALQLFVRRHELLGIASHFEGAATGPRGELLASLNPGLSMLMAEGIACPVEGDIKAGIALLIMKSVAGTATLAELYSMDFDNDVCIVGHSGAGDPAISSTRPVLRASEVFHGKTGRGYVTQLFPKLGPATLLAFTQDASGDYRLVAAEGEIVEGPTLHLGDTNCRMHFSGGLRAFIDGWSALGPTHHGVLGLGLHIGAIRRVAIALGIPLDVVRS
jgi:L-arabinose isomerase